jgi:hypothetical protein
MARNPVFGSSLFATEVEILSGLEVVQRWDAKRGKQLKVRFFMGEITNKQDYKILAANHKITTVVTGTSFRQHPHFRARTVHREHTHVQKSL